MPSEDEREQALHHAARLKGLSLVRDGDTFALAVFTAVTLDEIAAFLASDPLAGARPLEEHRRADLWAMLKVERALIAELEEEKRKARSGAVHDTIEAKLAEIRRRLAEIENARCAEVPSARAGSARP
jgi:hypothetical protein